MDWLPAVAVRPAGGGRVPRSAALLAAHVAWGWSAAAAMRELLAARATIFADGPDRNAPSS
jgi:hypothetical protein